MTIITPTIGRVVWFYPSKHDDNMMRHTADQPFKADVVYVWTDRLVNLSIIDHAGYRHTRLSVDLLQEGDSIVEGFRYCTWMPYQIGQAKKHVANVAGNVERIARVCHEVNRAYCQAIGDNSQPEWADAPDWQRQSASNGVKFTLANPDATPSASHESWLEEKRRGGWKHGPVKNPDTKEHPCFCPYDELPIEQRAKDHLFQAVVRALA